jgi:hypothetical protein
MHTNQKNIGIGFWLAWVLASAVGFGVGPILGVAILTTARVEGIAFPILFGAVFGVIGTLGQWMLIRRQAPEAGLWVPFSTMAFVLAVISAASPNISPDFNSLLILAGIYGLLGGFLQSLILTKRGMPIGWWIVASILGGLLGAAVNGSAIAAVDSKAAWQLGTLDSFLIWFRLGAPIGLGLGITTGATLIWFLRNPKVDSNEETAMQGTR